MKHRQLGRDPVYPEEIAALALRERPERIGEAARRALERIEPCRMEAAEHGFDGYTYVLGWERSMIKVGHTTDLVQRARDIQLMCPVQLDLIGICHWTGWERRFHDALLPEHCYGEWFIAIDSPIVMPIDGDRCWGCMLRKHLREGTLSQDEYALELSVACGRAVTGDHSEPSPLSVLAALG